MAHEEAFFVVIGVDEPASDAVGVIAADFTGVGVEDVDSVDLDRDLVSIGREYLDIGLAENDEEVSFAGVLQVIGHGEGGVPSRLKDWDAAELVEIGGARVVAERTGDKHVETGVPGFASGLNQIRPGDGS